MMLLGEQIDVLGQAESLELQGTVTEVRGLAVFVADLPAPIGAQVTIGPVAGEVVGFNEQQTVVMPIGSTAGIGPGDAVVAQQFAQTVGVSESMLGRVVDAMGRPLDGGGGLGGVVFRPLHPPALEPMDRPRIDLPLATGVRAIDALVSVGRGQRLGVIAAPGVGKSTLLGMMARGTDADVNVIALVGERGRELREFIDNNLGPEGLARSVVVCATSDEPPVMRLRSALTAAAVAEYFRDQGKDVLLIMDSVTRFCQAQRQIGLASGEPPATKGYPPSVFAILPALLERCGRTQKGSITGFFAVLMETEDVADPIAEAARGVLDGHVMLSRKLAGRGHWPAIDVVESISRVSDDVTDGQHQSARANVLKLINAYREVEDLLNIGAYAAGSNAEFDLAIACKPAVDRLLQQGRADASEKRDVDVFDRTKKQLLAVVEQIRIAQGELERTGRRGSVAA